MKKIVCILVIISLIIISIVGCATSGNEEKEIPTVKSGQEIAFTMGNQAVLIDEVRYYAYTSQATYETYFIAKEKKELNWKDIMSGKTTWTQGVKSLVFDDICKRECMYSYAEEYNVSLDEEEMKAVEKKVDEYFDKTANKIINKINISKDRLKDVFIKAAIATKVENIMNAVEKGNADKMYKTWKEENTITAEKNWDAINFDEPIFTMEDFNEKTS